jgi:penicillin-binding protein 2
MRDAAGAEFGTAYWALRQAGAGGIAIAGKTGTAEFPGPRDAKGNLPTHALFVGYAPYDDPKIAVAVVVYGGGEGADVAAPVAGEVMKAYFEIVAP